MNYKELKEDIEELLDKFFYHAICEETKQRPLSTRLVSLFKKYIKESGGDKDL